MALIYVVPTKQGLLLEKPGGQQGRGLFVKDEGAEKGALVWLYYNKVLGHRLVVDDGIRIHDREAPQKPTCFNIDPNYIYLVQQL